MEPENSYTTVSPPFWDEVFILGGGPSLRSFDLTKLEGKTVLAINDAALLPLPFLTAVFSLDNNWVRRNRSFLETFPGEKYVALPLETWPDCGGIEGVQYLQWAHQNGLSEDPHFLNTGGNSGYAAINLAYLKKARTIHLLGYDMNPKDNEVYFTWAPLFRTMRPQLSHHAVEVLNHNRNSYIDAFDCVVSLR